jgi:hypothetical protein
LLILMMTFNCLLLSLKAKPALGEQLRMNKRKSLRA